jgi:hypothetical protein
LLFKHRRLAKPEEMTKMVNFSQKLIDKINRRGVLSAIDTTTNEAFTEEV